MKDLRKKYANITIKNMKGVAVCPILTKEFASRGQVNLIDMQAMSSSNYKWIMVYQDHLTKCNVPRAISSLPYNGYFPTYESSCNIKQ